MADEETTNDHDISQDDSSLESSDSTSSLESTDDSSLESKASNTGKIDDTPETEATNGSFAQRIVRRINVYLLVFILLLIVAGAIVLITYLASKKTSTNTVKTQSLSSDTLKQLATSDVTVGQPKQVLSVQSNAVFAGKVLIRDSLEVAGPIQVGGSINVPGITVSGNSIFEQIQVNKSLSVQGDTTLQGQLTIQKGLTVASGGSFGGAVTAPALTVNTLQMNGSLTLTKHIIIGGATPTRDTGPALGGGGTVAVSGSDAAGSININTGAGPAAGCFVTVNFTQKYNTTPNVLITPIGSSAALVGYYVNRTTGSFSICAANTPPANASFGYDYFIVE